jgi:hypothetical protein
MFIPKQPETTVTGRYSANLGRLSDFGENETAP